MSNLHISKKPTFILARNPQEIELIQPNVYSTLGNLGRLYLCLDEGNAPAASSNFVLERDGSAYLSFELVVTPTLRDQLPSYVSGSFDTFVTSFLQHLQRHPTLMEHYAMSMVPTNGNGFAYIVFESRVRGSVGALAISGDNDMNYEPTNTVTVAGTDDTVKENYAVRVTVESMLQKIHEQQTERTEGIELHGVADPDTGAMRLTMHDLPTLLGNMMGPDIPLNAFKIAPAKKCCALLRLEFAESWTDATTKSIVQQAGDMTTLHLLAQNGGTSLSVADGEAAVSDFSGTGTSRHFLNMAPGSSKLSSLEQPQWLSFVADVAGTWYVRFRIYYTDNTSSDLSKTFDHPYDFNWVYHSPAGWYQNGLEAVQPAKTPLRYEVAVIDPNNDVSNSFEFILDERYQHYERFFIFENSLGVMDSLRCVGVNSFTAKRSGSTAKRAITSNTRQHQGSVEMIWNEVDREFTMRTGYITKAEKEYLIDLLNSTYVAEVIMPLLEPEDAGARGTGNRYFVQPYRACVITSDSVQMWEEGDDVFAMEWKMKYAHAEVNQSTEMEAVPDEWFDTEVEMLVEVSALGSSPQRIVITPGAGNFKVYLNNSVQDWSSGYLAVSATGIYHLKVMMSEADTLTVDVNNLTATIKILKLESPSLTELHITDFEYCQNEYLGKRLATLWNLEELTVTTNQDPGFDVNLYLSSLVKNWEEGLAVLTTVDFTGSTPDVAGAQLKQYLDDEGITITTS